LGYAGCVGATLDELLETSVRRAKQYVFDRLNSAADLMQPGVLDTRWALALRFSLPHGTFSRRRGSCNRFLS